MLYPLLFNPILKETVWGGDYLFKNLKKGTDAEAKIGESWEMSTVGDDVSIVSDGAYKGLSLTALINKYKGRMLGETVYEHFGDEFPILVKIIDAQADLSVQVHPAEEYAQVHHKKHGKTEMWYVIDAEKDAKIIAGLDRPSSKAEFENAIKENTVMSLLRKDSAIPGDVFYIPAGRIHALGAGSVVVEIQQTSDVTYRVYDYDRRNLNGEGRELHIDDALAVSDFSSQENYKTNYKLAVNEKNPLVSSPFFKTNILKLDKSINMDYKGLDSFVVLVCLGGGLKIKYAYGELVINKGDSLFLPAEMNVFEFIPMGEEAHLLEVFM